jgi:hypothetical protein
MPHVKEVEHKGDGPAEPRFNPFGPGMAVWWFFTGVAVVLRVLVEPSFWKGVGEVWVGINDALEAWKTRGAVREAEVDVERAEIRAQRAEVDEMVGESKVVVQALEELLTEKSLGSMIFLYSHQDMR